MARIFAIVPVIAIRANRSHLIRPKAREVAWSATQFPQALAPQPSHTLVQTTIPPSQSGSQHTSDRKMAASTSHPVPDSAPGRSRPPKKKIALTAADQQSAQVEALFANPERASLPVNVGPKGRTIAAPPEIVASVQGSSAGAGSGEFHVYKASRRREYERLRIMEEENQAEEAEEEFRRRRQEREKEDAAKLNKNRAKREKMKLRQQRKKLGPAAQVEIDNGPALSQKNAEGTGSLKRKLAPSDAASPPSNGLQTPEPDAVGTTDAAAVGDEVGITIHDDD